MLLNNIIPDDASRVCLTKIERGALDGASAMHVSNQIGRDNDPAAISQSLHGIFGKARKGISGDNYIGRVV